MSGKMLKLKAFIYRFSLVFGLSIYLANKEEDAYINSLRDMSNWETNIHRGIWQASNGFTSIWTWGKPWYKALWIKLKHAFDFRSYE